jgi:hypothetical protein
MATTTHRVHATWADQSAKQKSGVSRVLPTWLRDRDGTWRIFSGMSAPADGKWPRRAQMNRSLTGQVVKSIR